MALRSYSDHITYCLIYRYILLEARYECWFLEGKAPL